MTLVELARKLRPLVELASASLDDRTASEGYELLPKLKGDGSLIEGGYRINWNGRVLRARTALWDRAENWPDNAPELWEEVGYRQGMRVIPEVISAENPFSKGEKGWWGDELYESLIDANVWTPAAWPEGWKKAED